MYMLHTYIYHIYIYMGKQIYIVWNITKIWPVPGAAVATELQGLADGLGIAWSGSPAVKIWRCPAGEIPKSWMVKIWIVRKIHL